jgi:hypothetical protein
MKVLELLLHVAASVPFLTSSLEGFHGNSDHIFWLHLNSVKENADCSFATFHTDDIKYCV